jgi:hypothetical protein
MSSSSTSQWSLLLVLTALCLSLLVLLQIASGHAAAYFAAPREVASILDAVDSSVQENESYDRDVARVQRIEDKMRLGRLLREIQRCGDDLREDLNRLLVSEDDQRLRTAARVLWASRRAELEGKVRRLDMLRMRFLVVYMGIVAAGLEGKPEKKPVPARDPEKAGNLFGLESARPSIPRALTESIKQRPPLRRLTTQSMGHNDTVEGHHRQGWAGVVQELQRSPLMHKRHASIETAMARTP